jgi:ribose transport system substrate-binding protein
MRLFRTLGYLALAAVALVLPACKRGGSQSETYAFITNNDHDFWLIAEAGTKHAAQELGVNVEFKMPTLGGTPEEQQRLIEDLVNKGVKGIAISPNAAKDMVPFFSKTIPSNVPLITQDSDVPDVNVRRCYIGTHNYRAGRAAGKLVTEAAPNGGKIIIFVGKMDVQNAVERRQGLLDYLRDQGAGKKTDEAKAEIGTTDDPEATNVKVGNYILVRTQTDGGKRDVCQQRAEELFTVHRDLACVIGLWEYNPPAMLRALDKVEKKPAVIGFDENFDTLDAVKKGTVYATVVQNPYEFGRQSIKILHGLARGDEKVLQRDDIDAQKRIFIPHRIINRDNVDPFYEEVKKYKGK